MSNAFAAAFDDLSQPEPRIVKQWNTNDIHFFGWERLTPGPMTPSLESVRSYVYDEKHDMDVRAFVSGWALGLVGPTGVGKTTFAQYLAYNTGLELDEIVHSRHFESSDVLGEREQDASGRWIYGRGRLIEDYRLGRIAFLDELASVPPAVAQLYHPFIRGDEIRVRGENGAIEVVKRHPNFRIIAAWNPVIGHGGNHELGFALMDRLLLVYFDAISLDKEVEALVAAAPSVGRDLCVDLATFAAKWREGARANPDSIRYSISTRTLLVIVGLMEAIDAPLQYAVQRKIYDPVSQNFPDELDTVQRMLTAHVTIE
jgi:hypothetical protein